ncbi:MAG TPA: metallophosphoesterase, partial [Gammaproteobacteria bacterium]|nr:metallophosphoesterase [Gammaproteobacteria bacterium]
MSQASSRKSSITTGSILCILLAVPGIGAHAEVLTLEVQVSASSDDAEQTTDGYFSTTSSDLELIESDSPQRVGIRFNEIQVPRGVLISDAYVQFQVDEASSESVSLVIAGEAADDAVSFSAANDVLSRVATSATVLWSPAAWSPVGAAGPDQRTPDIAAVLQEIVNREGWTAGNSLVILIEGSGTRTAESFDGDVVGAPRLHLQYTISDQEAPVVDAGTDQVITLPAGAFLDGSVTDDGLPVPPGVVTTTWRQVGGAGSASFADPSLVDTDVSFSIAGTYVLRLSANDGEKIASDDVVVTAEPGPFAPVISSISPGNGQVATVVAISGENFSVARSVAFNGASASFRILSDTTIHSTVPPGAGTGVVTVSNQWGLAQSATEFVMLASPPVLVGAGDIASCNGNAEQTALLLDEIPGTVFTTGDHAYEEGTPAEFDACYQPTWGRHNSRTRPVPGNHDYKTLNATGYYDYFGPAAGDASKGYYSYDIGDWHVVALNSECAFIGGCDSASPQGQWLRRDLVSNPGQCTMAYWHTARYSSSLHGSDPTYSDLWQILFDAGVELVVSAHDHTYERFAPQDANGNAHALGVRAFVVGTGGRSLYGISKTEPNSEIHNDDTYGVLKLALNTGSYEWEFIPVAGGTFTDQGSAACQLVNQRPLVDAGPDIVVTWPDTAEIVGQSVDDGLPSASFATSWELVSGPGTATFGNSTAAETTVSFSQKGAYVLRLSGDDGEYVESDDVRLFVVDAGTEIGEIQAVVTSGLDDVEESTADGSVYTDSSDLEIVSDPVTVGSEQIVGIRFATVDIPQGATILSAELQFQVDEASSEPTFVAIRGEAIDDSPGFSATNGNLSARSQTMQQVEWAPPSWLTPGAAGEDQRTPDLGAVIQEIVDRSGWESGNAISFLIEGSGQRIAESFDGSAAAAAKLQVIFGVSPAG